MENKQLLVDKFIPKVTSAVPGSPPAAVPPGTDADTVRAPLVYEYMCCILTTVVMAAWLFGIFSGRGRDSVQNLLAVYREELLTAV